MELISNDFYGFDDWCISEKVNNIKANEGIWTWKIYRFQQLYEATRIVNEGFRIFPARGLSILWRKPGRA
jgi:hypothetical protein